MSSLLPPSAGTIERVFEEVVAARLATIERDIQHFLDPYKCRLDLLPYLAWELSVDDWDDAWSEQVKRDVVAVAIALHVTKGTRYAVRRALESLGYTSVQIIEPVKAWRNGRFRRDGTITHGDSMHWAEFDVLLNVGAVPDAQQIAKIRDYIANYKPRRSHLRHLRYTSKFHNGQYHRDGSITRDGGYVNG